MRVMTGEKPKENTNGTSKEAGEHIHLVWINIRTFSTKNKLLITD